MTEDFSKIEKLLHVFPILSKLDTASKALLNEGVIYMKEKAGSILFSEGNPCRGYVLLLDGHVKVQKTSEQGREIILYRVEKGESCIMTTSCLISNKEYNAEGIAESDIILAVIPQPTFNLLLGSSELFRKFTFEVYAERMAMLMMLIEEVVFKKLDERLAKLLIDKNQLEITTTHQDMASELGSVREVVSRQMKIFERSGMIELHRGKVKILDKTALQNYSNI